MERFMFVTDAHLKDALQQWEVVLEESHMGEIVTDHAEQEAECIRRELTIRAEYDTLTEEHMNAFKAIQGALDGDFNATIDMLVSMGASVEKGIAFRRIFTSGRQY
jgi:hypothetical protein